MNEAWPNYLVLGTVAKYATDPMDYSPDQAWSQTISLLAGGDKSSARALEDFADNSQSSELYREESPTFTKARDSFLTAYQSGPFWQSQAAQLRSTLQSDLRAAAVLPNAFPHLQAEADCYITSLGQEARLAIALLDTLTAQRPSLTAGVNTAY
jgi:hypothetical protein